MNLQSHFQRSLFVLVLLGMVAFALAADSMAVWILGGAVLLVNAWLVRTRRFNPLPPAAANILAIAALLVVGRELFAAGARGGLLFGQFLFALILAKLWQKRTYRDDAQILLLSIIVTGVGALNATSLFFGLLLLAYVPLALYCCILRHLLSQGRKMAAASGYSVTAPPPFEAKTRSGVRNRQRTLRSVRRVVCGLAVPSFMIATVVFIFFPRGRGDGAGPAQSAPHKAEAFTGFNDEVELGRLSRIAESNEVVAYAEISRNGHKATGNDLLLLRGITLDSYARDPQGAWRWSRTTPTGHYQSIAEGDKMPTVLRMPKDRWTQTITLQPTGTRVLFEIAGPLLIAPRHSLRVRFGRDEALELEEPPRQTLQYTVISSGAPAMRGGGRWTPPPPAPAGDMITLFARRPEVSGSDAHGPLARRRPASQSTPNELDEQIAGNISRYLHKHFTYTLDLSDAAPLGDRDPIAAFIYDQKRGNCEYFAGAMTLMCQRLGLRARIVAGFRCDEYNAMTEQYVVRQSQAHTWVEVLTPQGWRSFDPTTDRVAGDRVRQPGLALKAAHLFEYIELAYTVHVIAYDNADRDEAVDAIRAKAEAFSLAGANALQRLNDDFGAPGHGTLGANHIGAGIATAVLVAAGLLVLIWLGLRRLFRLRRAKTGSNDVAAAEARKRMREQLQFYEDLVEALAQRRIVRPIGLTQLEFSHSLRWLPPDVFRRLERLTYLFYRVRFGRRELTPGRIERLRRVVSDLVQRLAADHQASTAET